jgi:hypothetical protein
MASAVELYGLASAPDERTRARLIAEAFELLEARDPHVPELATQRHLRETELRLQKGISQLRGDVLTEIEQLRGEIKTETQTVKVNLLTSLVPIMFGQVAVVAALVKLL